MSKVIAVTGATSGMGKASVEQLSACGHRVYGTAYGVEINPDWKHLPYTLIPCDITAPNDVEAFFERIREEAKRIDVLVNCAGFALEGGVEDSTVEEARSQFEVNVFGTHRMIREVLPIMRQQGSGRIITISSLAAQVPAVPFQNPGAMRTDFTANRVRAAALTPKSPYYEQSMKSVSAMKKSEMSSQGPERIGELVCKLVEARRLKPKYFLGSKYKALLFLMRFMSNKRAEKLIESLYCPS
jgi:NAD(P)-dependent dehydrogenase (short-subunit alcohol dehydrogenase family)